MRKNLRVALLAVLIFAAGFFIVGPLVDHAHADAIQVVVTHGHGPAVTAFPLHPGWQHIGNVCVTNYDRIVCGTGWHHVTAAHADVYAEAYGGPRLHEHWQACIDHIGPTSYVLCPDGRLFNS